MLQASPSRVIYHIHLTLRFICKYNMPLGWAVLMMEKKKKKKETFEKTRRFMLSHLTLIHLFLLNNTVTLLLTQKADWGFPTQRIHTLLLSSAHKETPLSQSQSKGISFVQPERPFTTLGFAVMPGIYGPRHLLCSSLNGYLVSSSCWLCVCVF